MATKIRPIVFKINEPEGFVMNGSNATISGTWIYWQSPAYPNGYDGNGKSYTIVNNYSGDLSSTPQGLMYLPSNNITSGGPTAISGADMVTGSGTMSANQAGVASGYGAYLGIPMTKQGTITEAEMLEFAASITITILD